APTAEGPELDAPDPTPEPASPSAPDTSHRSSPTGSAHVDKHPTSAATAVEPMPRQITTIPVPHSGPDAVDNYKTSITDSTEPFVQEKPGPKPYFTHLTPVRHVDD